MVPDNQDLQDLSVLLDRKGCWDRLVLLAQEVNPVSLDYPARMVCLDILEIQVLLEVKATLVPLDHRYDTIIAFSLDTQQ